MSETLPPLPKPDTHCFDEDTGKDVWSHSPEQMQAYATAAIQALRAQIGQGEPVGRVAWAADVENTIKEVRWTVFAPPVDTLLYAHNIGEKK